MVLSKLRSRIGRIAVTTTAVATTMVLAATAAHASQDLSDTASWGWTSVSDISFEGESNEWVGYNPGVNDSIQDGWSVTVVVRAHDYDGTTRASASYTDTTHDGNARYFGRQWLYAYSIYALSIQLCKTKSDGSSSCRSRKYTYR